MLKRAPTLLQAVETGQSALVRDRQAIHTAMQRDGADELLRQGGE